MTERAVIIGGRGFIGTHLARYLASAGWDVVCVDIDASRGALLDGEMAFHHEDMRDTAAVAAVLTRCRPTAVFHLAAMHFIPECERRPENCIDINIHGTRSVLAASAIASVPRVVVVSSAAVYAPMRRAHGESAAVGPTDVYGHTKLMAEHFARTHARGGAAVAIARLFNVVGAEETNPHILPSLASQALAGEVLRVGNLDSARDYVHVRDVCDAVARLGHLAVPGQVVTVNVGTEVATTGHELVELLRTATGRPLRVEQEPQRVRSTDRPVLVSDCGLAHELLGWKPQFSLAEAVADVLAAPWAPGRTLQV